MADTNYQQEIKETHELIKRHQKELESAPASTKPLIRELIVKSRETINLMLMKSGTDAWDWWKTKFESYIDFLFVFGISELKFFGYTDFAFYAMGIHAVVKAVAKNGKNWFSDLRDMDAVMATMSLGLVTMALVNYFIYKNTSN